MKVKVVYAKCKQGLTLCAAAQCQGLWGLRGWEVRLSLGGACPELSRKEENSGRGELALYLATYLIDRTRDLGGLFLQEWGCFSPKMRDIPSKQQYGHSVIQVARRMNMYFL